MTMKPTTEILNEMQTFFNIMLACASLFGLIFTVLLFRMYNLFPSRKEMKESIDKLSTDIRAAERNHSNLHMEFEKQKIHLDHLKETIERGFKAQQDEMKHLSSNIKQFANNSSAATKAVMELEDKFNELSRRI